MGSGRFKFNRPPQPMLPPIVKRAIAVLVTAMVIVIPIFTYTPRLYKWLVEYRLRALYRRLRKIEASLQKSLTAPEILTLEDEIESLDRDIINLGVPMKHSDLYFMIKSHLNLVRTRIGLCRNDFRGKRTTARLVR